MHSQISCMKTADVFYKKLCSTTSSKLPAFHSTDMCVLTHGGLLRSYIIFSQFAVFVFPKKWETVYNFLVFR